MAKNPHFRVLALTATPGSTTEAVQEIVDSLHISRIEIRDEKSIDLQPYMHKKVCTCPDIVFNVQNVIPLQEIKQHIIKMNEGIYKVMDLLSNIMEVLIVFGDINAFSNFL